MEELLLRVLKIVERDDILFMREALRLGRRGLGRTSPNPAVGAVIVKNGKIIGEGWHKKAGKPHAEVEAIRSCKVSLKGATMYVTLSPCNHVGKTGPCAVAIIEAGIKEVVIGSKDKSPKTKCPGLSAWAAVSCAHFFDTVSDTFIDKLTVFDSNKNY